MKTFLRTVSVRQISTKLCEAVVRKIGVTTEGKEKVLQEETGIGGFLRSEDYLPEVARQAALSVAQSKFKD